jgi:predicted Zn finger-like uncharacterized protein
MLITTCAHCRSRFRVTPQQLNAKQGQVRCGKCAQVFNGFQSLERFPDDDTGGRLLAEHEASRIRQGPAPRAEPAPAVDLPLFDEPAGESAPASGAAPGRVGPPIDLEFEQASASETAPATDSQPEPATDSQPASPAEADLHAPEPALEPAPAIEGGEAPRPRHRIDPALTLQMEAPAPPARAWRFAAAFLALVLALEVAFAYRGPLAQRYPVLRPTLESICARAGCTVAWSRDEALLKLEDSELLEVPGRPTEIALGARIRNLAAVAQEFPHLELTLTDLGGQAAVRRVLRPTDYLGRPVGYGEVIAAGTEVAIQLRLETPRLKATGYELLVFYP